jgi:Trypsin-like serine proteases, typically periplasmic, contain C-terminal PDZ domain
MKKLFLIVIVLLLPVALQSCVHLSENAKYLRHFEKLAKENPGSFIAHGYIGINVKLNYKGEIEITDVGDDSPAKREGIKPGDIILEIDSIPITDKYQAFKIYDSKYPGDSATVVLKRHNKLLTKHLLNLPAFYTPAVFNVLYEKVYKGIPIRLAIIPTPILLPSSLEEGRAYLKNEMELKRYFEGAMLNFLRGHENLAIIDRQHTEKVLDEIKFQQSGLVKDESRIKIGQMLGATHLLLVNRSVELRGGNEVSYVIWLELVEVESNKKLATTVLGSEKKNLGKEFYDYIRTGDVRNDLQSYGRRVNEFINAESVALKAYKSVTGENYKDEKTFQNVLRETVIPKYAEYLTGMKSINPVTADVKAAHKLFVEAISLQYEAFQEMLEASETNNRSMFSEANNKMTAGRQLMEHSAKQFEDLVAKNISRFNDKN